MHSKHYKIGRAVGTALGWSLGASLSWLTSAPSSPFKVKFPEEDIKNVEIFPNLVIKEKDKTIHIHHWFYLTFFYATLSIVKKGFPASHLLKGVLIGCILQGLTYGDRFKVREKEISS